MEVHLICLRLEVKIAVNPLDKRVPHQMWSKRNCFQASKLLNNLRTKSGKVSKEDLL